MIKESSNKTSKTSTSLVRISDTITNTQIIKKSKKNKISKYDMIKIKVRLGQHWFIFSRYILSNILQVIHIPEKEAQKLAFMLKKKFIELGLMDVTLQEFHDQLFEILKENNYDQIYKDRYLMMNSFYKNRVPLIILITGSVLVGKSSIANQLSERINVSNVLQTKIVSIVMSSINVKYKFPVFWKEEELNKCIELYKYESNQIRKGCSLDMIKAYKEGKPVILEGHHILPTNFIAMTENNQLCLFQPEDETETSHEKSIRDELNSLKRMKGLIIPILLTTDESSHLSFIKNSIGLVPEKEQNQALKVFRVIQDCLIKENNYFIEIQVKYNKEIDTIDEIHRLVIDRIEKAYNEGLF